MSVQAGIWNFDGQPISREFLAQISQGVKEYGPDDETTFLDGPIGMLYRPFHTTTESRLEHQPHISASGRIIMWDGRLDNRDELISCLGDDLRDYLTDVSIVTAVFDRWGTSGFSKLIGDWAITIWDPREKELILSVDYIGIKHLF